MRAEDVTVNVHQNGERSEDPGGFGIGWKGDVRCIKMRCSKNWLCTARLNVGKGKGVQGNRGCEGQIEQSDNVETEGDAVWNFATSPSLVTPRTFADLAVPPDHHTRRSVNG